MSGPVVYSGKYFSREVPGNNKKVVNTEVSTETKMDIGQFTSTLLRKSMTKV